MVGNTTFFEEDLNKENIKENNMEISERDVYKALKYYMNIDNKKLEKNKFPFSPRVIVRLMRQGYIIIKKFERLTQEDKLNFFHTDYVVTLKGYDKFCKLREVYQKDWSFILTITNIIVAITTIILFTKAMGWW